jgi:5-methylcytosine-specific restriction protein A
VANWGNGRGGRPWRRLRDQVMARDKYLCQPCQREGRLTEATEVDHIVCKAKGGQDRHDNLEAICTPCHERKTLRDSGVNVRESRAERRQRDGDHWSR